MLGLSAKLYPRILGLTVTPDPKIIFVRKRRVKSRVLGVKKTNRKKRSKKEK